MRYTIVSRVIKRIMKMSYLRYFAVISAIIGCIYYFAPEPSYNTNKKNISTGSAEQWGLVENEKKGDLATMQKQLIHEPAFGYVEGAEIVTDISKAELNLAFYGVVMIDNVYKVIVEDASDSQLYGIDSVLPGYGTICEVSFNSFTICGDKGEKQKHELY